ncbi:helix-turn-helix domain-containing protein [Nonomuraea wenchangensis]|nr:helix-turn-helix transcriptional regulator [Nonomuraea wenchangensis]
MSESRVSPPYRLRLLGMELARLRAARGMTGAQVAHVAGVTPSALSRLERGRNTYVTAGDVRRLLDCYQASTQDETTCLRLVAEGRGTPYWEPYERAGALSEPVEYVALETEAREVRYWHPLMVPTLLQTFAYAQELLAAQHTDPAMVQLRARARMARQWIIRCGDPARLRVIVGEDALRLPVGETAVMRGQLVRLLDDAALPHVSVRVLPRSVGAHPGMAGGFVLLTLPPLGDVLFVESGGGLLVEDGPGVAACSAVFGQLDDLALSEKESAALMLRVLRES